MWENMRTVDIILLYVFCRIMVLLLVEWFNWHSKKVDPITSQNIFGRIFSTSNITRASWLRMKNELGTYIYIFFCWKNWFPSLYCWGSQSQKISREYLLTRFLFLPVSKESATEFRRLGAILRHCLISRADGEEQTEEFHGYELNATGFEMHFLMSLFQIT